MPKYYKDWSGFRHNKRNKYPYNESKLNNIIQMVINEAIEKIINE